MITRAPEGVGVRFVQRSVAGLAVAAIAFWILRTYILPQDISPASQTALVLMVSTASLFPALRIVFPQTVSTTALALRCAAGVAAGALLFWLLTMLWPL